jgi:hypothetical protein
MATYYVREKCDDYGVSCKFYRISDTVGLKIYPLYFPTALMTFDRQLRASKFGLAPKCWDFSHGKYRDMYLGAYLTEIADVNINKSIIDQQKLKNDLLKIGYDVTDLHYKNWGYLSGLPVCVDFSCVKFDETD